MAQSKLNDLAGKFSRGGPPGMTTGLKILAAVGAGVYGISQSLYTGKLIFYLHGIFYEFFEEENSFISNLTLCFS